MAYVIIGLGNPEGEYEHTRHNAGRMVVEKFARDQNFDDFTLRKAAKAQVSSGVIEVKNSANGERAKAEKVELVLPEVAMNLSGKVVPSFVKSVKAAQKLLVIRDDLDMPLGTMKMTIGRGSGGHRGVESIMRALKTKDFVQLKIGISRASPKGKVKKPLGEDKVIKYVIGKFSPKEEHELKKILKKASTITELFITEGLEKATMEANTK